MSDIVQLYSDKLKTTKAYPKTLASETYMSNGRTVESQLEDMWRDITEGEVFEVTLPPKQTGISATFTQGNTMVYPSTSLDSLKSMLVVNKVYDNNTTETTTNYTLSGTLTIGTSTITVTSGSYKTSFNVIVTEKPVATLLSISAVFNQGGTVIYPSTSLDNLKSLLVVTASYDDESLVVVSDYTLSGVLTVGNSTVTVDYEGKTTSFNVTVTKESGYVTDGLAGYFNLTTYDNAYTGDIVDNSGINKVVASVHEVEKNASNPDFSLAGFINGEFRSMEVKKLGGLSGKKMITFNCNENESFRRYPYTVEFYGKSYGGLHDGVDQGSIAYPFEIFTTRYNKSDDVTTGVGVRISVTDENTIKTAGSLGQGNNEFTLQSPYKKDEYHHFVVCVEQAKTQLYIDNVLIGEGTATNNASLISDMSCVVINSGFLKMVRFYDNKILSVAEIAKNYNDVISTIGGVS